MVVEKSLRDARYGNRSESVRGGVPGNAASLIRQGVKGQIDDRKGHLPAPDPNGS